MSFAFPTIPEGLDLIPTPDGMIIRKVWLSWIIIPMGLFVLVWDSFLFVLYNAMLSDGWPGIMILFPSLHLAVGIGLTWYVLASLVNRTDIIVSSTSVRVTHRPAPWPGNKEVKAENISEILVRMRVGNRGSRTWSVMYAGRARRERKLVAWIAQSDQAEFIARVIREVLGLTQKE